MINAFYFIICNLFLIISTVAYLKVLNVKGIKNKLVFGIIIYFFRIIAFELLLGVVIKNIQPFTICITSIIENLILVILFKIGKKSLYSVIKEEVIELKKIKFNHKINFNFMIFIIFIITFCIIMFVALFVYEYSFDGNYYHLSHIIDYIQEGKIFITNNTLWNNVYPQNIELLNMFYMMFTKSIFLTRLPQIIFSLLGIIVVYSLLRELNFKKDTSYKCSILYFVSPFILAQITTTYLDGIVVTLMLSLIYALVKILKTNQLKYEILYFLILSIFMGTKGTCSIYAVLISLIYIIFKIIKVIKKEEKIANLIIKCGIFLSIVIIIGCTWMVQNIILFKNPIHPFKFMTIEGLDANIDIGVENEPYCIRGNSSIIKILKSWVSLNSGFLDFDTGMKIENLFQTHDSRIGGLGIGWLYFLVPSILISICFISSKTYKINKYHIIVSLILTICFLLTPANWWGRYVGFIIFLGFIGYGILIESLKNKRIKQLINAIYLLIVIFSIIFCTKFAITKLVYEEPYGEFDSNLRQYINSSEEKKILLLEDSYYNTHYIAFLKGNNIQNKVNTYFINQMYLNEQVSNHNIGDYINFESLQDLKDSTSIIILDATKNRKNYKYMEQFYLKHKSEYNKIRFGKDILIYEKNIK